MTYPIPFPHKGKTVGLSNVANFATVVKNIAPLVGFCASQGFVYDEFYPTLVDCVERELNDIVSRLGLINAPQSFIDSLRTSLLAKKYRDSWH